MRIAIVSAAQAELDEAAAYYADHASPRIAEAFLTEFVRAQQRLAEHPAIGTPLSKRLRIFPMRGFPYSIIYRQTADALLIYAVANQHRRPGYWRQRG